MPPAPKSSPLFILTTAAVLLLPCERGWSQAAQPEPFTPLPKDVSLQPLPATNSGLVTFVGNQSYTAPQLEAALTEQIRDIREGGLTKARADDTAYYLAVYYRKQGYSKVEVNWAIRGSHLILTINEGPRSYLRQVIFEGNRYISDQTLFEYMVGGTRERFIKEPKLFPFVEADAKTGVERVRGLYESEGYADAVVDDPLIRYSRNFSDVEVRVRIKEGLRYGFGTVDFLGDTLFLRNELIAGLGESLDQPYTTQRLNTMQRNLVYFYKSHGYYDAAVEASSSPELARSSHRNPDGSGFDRLVPVRFTVKPGAQYRFDGVTVTGLDRLRPSFVQNRFRKLHGEIYDPAKLDETYREMLRTGLFQNLRINSVPQPDHTIRLELTAQEAKAKEFGFSIGASTYEGFIVGLRLADRDLGGNGRPLSLEFEQSQRALRAELVYQDPWLFESDYSLRARLYAQKRNEEGYSKRETGLRLDLTRKIGKTVELGVFAQAQGVEIVDSVIDPIYLGPTAYQVATFGFTQTFDHRDNPLNPSRGWIISTSVDADAIAGDIAFGRATARLSYYWPVGKSMMLAAGARGGLIYPLTSVPIDERFFNGGGTTVRSFRERRLGPKDPNGHPIGGEAFTVFNLELDFPIHGALHGAAFVDAGNLIEEFKNAGVEEMRFALGLGLRYKLPIGPIRLDVGINPDPKQGESWGAVHFSFGFAF